MTQKPGSSAALREGLCHRLELQPALSCAELSLCLLALSPLQRPRLIRGSCPFLGQMALEGAVLLSLGAWGAGAMPAGAQQGHQSCPGVCEPRRAPPCSSPSAGAPRPAAVCPARLLSVCLSVCLCRAIRAQLRGRGAGPACKLDSPSVNYRRPYQPGFAYNKYRFNTHLLAAKIHLYVKHVSRLSYSIMPAYLIA